MKRFEITSDQYTIVMTALERYKNEMKKEALAARESYEPSPAYEEWISTCATICAIEDQA